MSTNNKDPIDRVKVIGCGLVVIFLLFIAFLLFKFTQDFPIFTWNISDRTPKQVLDSWKDTSSILNSLISPILLFFSVVLLWLTWRTSRSELIETRKVINKQLSNQRRKDDLDILSRQTLYLNDKMNKKLKIFDLYNISAHDELFNFLEELYQNSDPRLIEFYKSIGFNYEEAQSSTNDFAEQLYLKLYPIEYSQNELVLRGSMLGHNYNEFDYFSHCIRLKSHKVKNIFLDVFSMIYMRNIHKNQNFISIMLLLRKIHNTQSDHKKELIEEFKLTFNLEIAKNLIQLSSDIPNDFLE